MQSIQFEIRCTSDCMLEIKEELKELEDDSDGDEKDSQRLDLKTEMRTTHELKKNIFRKWKVVHEADEEKQIELDLDGYDEVVIVDGANCHHSPSSGITLPSLPHKFLRSSGKNLSPEQLSFDKVIRKEPTFTERLVVLQKMIHVQN